MNFGQLRSKCALTTAIFLFVLGNVGQAAADPISLAWDPSGLLVGYRVHVGTQSGSYSQHIDVGSSTSFTFPNAVAGQRYCFAVSAYLLSSLLEGPNSNEVCGYSNQAPTLANPGARTSTVGQTVTLQLQASDPDNQAVTFSATGLPPGLTLGTSTGFISGAGTTAGTYSVTARATDGVLSASQTFTWTMAAAASGGGGGGGNGGGGSNTAPVVNAGADQSITLPASANLSGSATDDGRPNPPATLTRTWSKVSGPGTVTFGNASAASTTASFSTAGTYVLRLTASDSALTASDDVTVTVGAAPSGGSGGSTGSGGTGLKGEYFSTTSLTGLVLTRTDATVDFSWPYGTSPAPAVATDNFSVRWTGYVTAPVSGSYTFSTISDDGVRLWVNGTQVINNWSIHADTVDTSAAITLQAGVKYAIKLEYYEATSGATIKLRWSYPGQAAQTIPQSALSLDGGSSTTPPPSTPSTPSTTAGLKGEYFSTTSLTGLVLTRTDATVDFSWPYGTSPAPAVATDNFSVRWTGYVTAPVSGSYTFSTISDDGVRLWVNGTQVINNWSIHGDTVDTSAAITLQAGVKYAIKLEYYEATSGATIKLRWAYPGQAAQVIPATALSQDASTSSPSTPTTGTPGLRGEYFSTTGLSGLVLTRTDAKVDFNYGFGSPDPSIAGDNFSVRWTGSVTAPVTGTYTFSTLSDDGVRLWVNGTQIVNNWTVHGPVVDSGTISLQAGVKYAIRLEFYEQTSDSVIQLRWAYPGQATQVIPTSALSY